MANQDGYDHLRESADEVVPTCDICGRTQDDSPNIMPRMREHEADWNGETGNHSSCEEQLRVGRQAVIDEIVEDVKSGNARIYSRNDLEGLLRWLNVHTDTFDPVIMAITLDLEMDPKLNEEQIKELVADYVTTIGGE